MPPQRIQPSILTRPLHSPPIRQLYRNSARPPSYAFTESTLTSSLSHRSIPLFPLLARSASLLRREHDDRRRHRQAEVRARARGLLRVPAPQEGGTATTPVSSLPSTSHPVHVVLQPTHTHTPLGRQDPRAPGRIPQGAAGTPARGRAERGPDPELGLAGCGCEGGGHEAGEGGADREERRRGIVGTGRSGRSQEGACRGWRRGCAWRWNGSGFGSFACGTVHRLRMFDGIRTYGFQDQGAATNIMFRSRMSQGVTGTHRAPLLHHPHHRPTALFLATPNPPPLRSLALLPLLQVTLPIFPLSLSTTNPTHRPTLPPYLSSSTSTTLANCTLFPAISPPAAQNLSASRFRRGTAPTSRCASRKYGKVLPSAGRSALEAKTEGAGSGTAAAEAFGAAASRCCAEVAGVARGWVADGAGGAESTPLRRMALRPWVRVMWESARRKEVREAWAGGRVSAFLLLRLRAWRVWSEK